jgi:hypothetical protein
MHGSPSSKNLVLWVSQIGLCNGFVGVLLIPLGRTFVIAWIDFIIIASIDKLCVPESFVFLFIKTPYEDIY